MNPQDQNSTQKTFLACLVALMFFATTAMAKDAKSVVSTTDSNQITQALNDLALSEQWRHLLHYHRVGLFSSYQSQADDQDFFFAANGETDPVAELHATYTALVQNLDDAQCRFPARMAWINQQLPGAIKEHNECPEFEAWRDEIAAEGLTLVFPAAYLNSPSSMFGHTFIRLDSALHNNPLLDYSVNYAANADPSDNELVFSFKGLTGGYPGVFSILPYYEKVKEYSYLESRDVWEYKLDINKLELEQFVRHTWEIKDTHFDYFFFTENCSYHLLTLLDAASERFDLSDAFISNVIPADTVRVLNEAGLIEEAVFRPSSLSRMEAMQDEMSESQIQAAKSRVSQPIDLDQFDDPEKAQVLELAYRYTRYLATKQKDQSNDLAKTTLGLLSERSKLNSEAVFLPHPTPRTRDDQGHRSHRHQISLGHDEENFVEYGLRMSYHDWLDNLAGYISGARLEIIHGKLRYLTQQERFQIQEFRAIDIASLSPRDTFFKPLSWFVSTGLKRPAPITDELLPYLNAGPGLSYGEKGHLVSALWSTELGADSDIEKGYFLNSGPRAVWLYQQDEWSMSIEHTHAFDIGGAEFKHRQTKFGVSAKLGRSWQIRAEGQYDVYRSGASNPQEHRTSGQLSIMRYF